MKNDDVKFCTFCGQPIVGGCCSFCVAPHVYSSAEDAVRRYFFLLSRSETPSQDPSRENITGGAKGAIPPTLHERVRLSSIFQDALGKEWQEGGELWRVLVAFYGLAGGSQAEQFARLYGSNIQKWGKIAEDALKKIAVVMRERGFLKSGDADGIAGEEMVRGWSNIARPLGLSVTTAKRWYLGPPEGDRCGLQQAVKKIGRQIVVISRAELRKCWERLYHKTWKVR